MSMIHDITDGATKNRKRSRKGRGRSAGQGKTSGRGHKGAKARVGKYVKRGHEHGQTPIFRRLPKRGFSNYQFERRFAIVNLLDLEQFDEGTVVDVELLHEAGLVKGTDMPVKILGEGGISKKLTIVAGKYSKAAHKAIVDAGGTANNAKGESFEFPKVKKKFIPRDAAAKGSRKKAKPGVDDAVTEAPESGEGRGEGAKAARKTKGDNPAAVTEAPKSGEGRGTPKASE